MQNTIFQYQPSPDQISHLQTSNSTTLTTTTQIMKTMTLIPPLHKTKTLSTFLRPHPHPNLLYLLPSLLLHNLQNLQLLNSKISQTSTCTPSHTFSTYTNPSDLNSSYNAHTPNTSTSLLHLKLLTPATSQNGTHTNPYTKHIAQ